MTQIPAELIARAFQANNGEFAWTREDALRVVASMPDASNGILGGETWAVLEDGTIYAAIPQVAGSVLTVCTWTTEPEWQQESETWPEFCQRAAEQSGAVLERYMAFEADVVPEMRPRVKYNLTYVTQDEYLGLRVLPPSGSTDL